MKRAVTFYFQVHQPYRVRPYRFAEVGTSEAIDWYDDWLNEDVVKRVAKLCYLPMNEQLRRAIEDTGGAFKGAFSISGTALRQFEQWAPEVLESFAGLVDTGCVEMLCETSRHSLAALGSPDEFAAQVAEQRALLERHFGVRPTTFRNTELIVDPSVARQVRDLGFELLVGEGADDLLGRDGDAFRDHPGRLYEVAGAEGLPLFLRDYEYSDDVAFRFSNPSWDEHPLFAPTYLRWLEELPEERQVVGLFMDYETFGEHQPASTGVFEFMGEFLRLAAEGEALEFVAPRDLVGRVEQGPALPYPRPFSWADAERDLSAWLGNHMQRAAFDAIYGMRDAVLASGDAGLIEAWRDLTTSDHVYYMSTKFASDGDVHEYFSPYASPHDAFLTVMNAVEDLSRRVSAVR